MIELKNINKTYKLGILGNKKIVAADNVSFKIKDGGITSLIGESGSGKSTIGKMILKLLNPTSGELLFNGEDVSKYNKKMTKDYYKKVQGVFQDPFSSFNPISKADRIFKLLHSNFFPHIKTKEWQDIVDEKLISVGLNPQRVLNKFPHQLSGGQLQRLLIARALLLNVEFLVADEIISMLDASTRIDVLNLLGDLKSGGLSILFITHDLHLGYYISDSALIMYQGAIVEMGSTNNVFNNPKHPYTQMLFESVPRLDKKWDEIEREKINNNTAEKKEDFCKFYERCQKDCEDPSSPVLKKVTEDHFVVCEKI